MKVDNSTLIFRSGAALVAGLALLGSLNGCKPQAAATANPPPAEVVVETITPRRVAVTNELPGRIDAVRVAQVRARVAGILLRRVFNEGADVKAGDVLFEIDPAPFKANLASAQAALAKSEAAQTQADAQMKRYKSLFDQQAISQQDFDNANATALQTTAEVAAAKAALTNATLNLSYATVTAPISGRIGRALVTEGALVGQNETTPLATIQQLDPVYFDFTQSSTEVLKLRRALAAGTVQSLEPGTAPVTLLLEDGTVYQAKGKLLFSDISVDPNTGMLALRAEFPNPDRLLLPGMFARGRLEQAVQDDAITVPMRAVARGAEGNGSVMVVGAENKVEARTIKLGDAVGDTWIVRDGLKAGERVIVEGLQKTRPGATVNPVAPGASAPAPKPAAQPESSKK